MLVFDALEKRSSWLVSAMVVMVQERAIAELGYGTNTKFFAGYSAPVWRDARHAGNGFTDLEWQTCWDNSRGQGKAHAGMTFFLGGKPGATAESLDIKDFLLRSMRSLEPVLPGLERAWTGRQSRMFWPGQPFVRASYACYKPGQWKDVRARKRDRSATSSSPASTVVWKTKATWMAPLKPDAKPPTQSSKSVMERAECVLPPIATTKPARPQNSQSILDSARKRPEHSRIRVWEVSLLAL